jgi:hypothetical protein
MSDRSTGEIWIGGKIKRELVPDLCEAIRAQPMHLEWMGAQFEPTTESQLLEAIDDLCGIKALRLCNTDANGGEFSELERFLQMNDLPYTRHSGGCRYYDGRKVFYRPGRELVEVMTNVDGDSVIGRVEKVERAWYLLKEAQYLLQTGKRALAPISQAADLLADVLPPELPPLAPFEIAE